MFRIAVCDDEEALCLQLKQKAAEKLEEWRQPFEIICYTEPLELMHSAEVFDLLFLDIQMPELDGVALAKRLREQKVPCAIIFVTVCRDGMLDAFEVEASDYLLKPVDEGRLERALARVLKQWKQRKGQEEKRLFIQAKGWARSIRSSDIYYCEVINRKIYLHTKNGVIEYYGKMTDLEKQLELPFLKCHRSYFVNLYYLQQYADGSILLENGAQIPVSRRCHQSLLDAMLLLMK